MNEAKPADTRQKQAARPTEYCIGVDVGGTKVLGVVADPRDGAVVRQVLADTPRSGLDPEKQSTELLAVILTVIDRLMAAEEDAGRRVEAAGVGLPGLVDMGGVLRYGPNVPGVVAFDALTPLRDRFHLPVVVGNDATNAALAEHRFGAARGHANAIVVTQGTGIGGGLIVNGDVVRGAHGFAGEPGHMQIESGGFTCACGRVGCWETVSSGAGLRNLAQAQITEGRGEKILHRAGGCLANVRGEHVSAAFAAGDTDAKELVADFARWVAAGLGSLVSLLDPGIIVLGGGVMEFGDAFMADVQEHLPSFVMGGAYRPTVRIVQAELGQSAGAIGGAINASEMKLLG